MVEPLGLVVWRALGKLASAADSVRQDISSDGIWTSSTMNIDSDLQLTTRG